jgi:hypothetical protein
MNRGRYDESMARTPKRKNPAAAPVPVENTVRSMTTWLTDAGEQVTTIAVGQPDGRFLAYVAHAPDVRAVARSAMAAEKAAVGNYESRESPAEDGEDEAALVELSRRREKQPRIPWEQVKREMGLK